MRYFVSFQGTRSRGYCKGGTEQGCEVPSDTRMYLSVPDNNHGGKAPGYDYKKTYRRRYDTK